MQKSATFLILNLIVYTEKYKSLFYLTHKRSVIEISNYYSYMN